MFNLNRLIFTVLCTKLFQLWLYYRVSVTLTIYQSSIVILIISPCFQTRNGINTNLIKRVEQHDETENEEQYYIIL